MANTRVLVVDDSAAMRALFCDILDNAKGVEVCGTANSADEARAQIEKLKPDVLTLDVEMPGTSGMEFLEEIMANHPMPVIMLSSITQAGSGTAQRALELGAVHCFPKPLHSNREEFHATVAKLGGVVRAAASGELKPGGTRTSDDQQAQELFEPDGSLVLLSGGASSLDSLKGILAAYPTNCPPTVVVLDGDPSAIREAMETVRSSVACQIEDAIDGKALKPGVTYLAYNPTRHVIIERGDELRLREIDRDPVNGCRPSADLLMGSVARTGVSSIGGLLVGKGSDGAKGVQMLAQGKGQLFVHCPPDYAPKDRFDAVKGLGLSAAELTSDQIASWIIERTNANTLQEAA